MQRKWHGFGNRVHVQELSLLMPFFHLYAGFFSFCLFDFLSLSLSLCWCVPLSLSVFLSLSPLYTIRHTQNRCRVESCFRRRPCLVRVGCLYSLHSLWKNSQTQTGTLHILILCHIYAFLCGYSINIRHYFPLKVSVLWESKADCMLRFFFAQPASLWGNFSLKLRFRWRECSLCSLRLISWLRIFQGSL